MIVGVEISAAVGVVVDGLVSVSVGVVVETGLTVRAAQLSMRGQLPF
jgi:hypothetical protein